MKGLSPSVRKLTWPDSVSPLNLPGFETQARRLRYQALGDECRKRELRCLLLAHHDDDQAETVLMRLASGHKGIGLRGMQPYADIPECWGVHGVHQSGRKDQVASRLRREDAKDPLNPKAQHLRRLLDKWDIFEGGGVTIIRPLLGFSKERIIQTCLTQNWPWEEDKTNKDIWRTPRNNIRALLRSAKLPQALQKSSMLQLAKQTSDSFKKTNAVVSRLLTCCEVLLLDARCGGLIVRLPSKPFLHRQEPRRGEAWRIYKGEAQLKAMLLLHYFVRIVSPQEEVSLQSLKQAAVSVFPELVEADRKLQPTSFTGGSVQFQRLYSPLPASRSEFSPAMAGKWEDLDPVFVWKLTRQPFSTPPPSLTVQPSANTDSKVADSPPSWSPWQLWDGRYWIRLLNRSCQALVVRSFQPSDIIDLRSTLTPQRYKDFHKFLTLAAPGKVRWTLLAVAELGDDTLTRGRVLALPTLGQAGIFNIRDANGTNKVEWQVRYKHVSLGYEVADDGVARIARDSIPVTSWED